MKDKSKLHSPSTDPRLPIKNYNLGSVRCNSRVKIFYKNISEKKNGC